LASEVGGKLDRADFERLTLPELRAKADKADLDHILATLTNDRRQNEVKFNEQIKEVETYMNLLKGELEKLSSDLFTAVAQKADNRDVDRLTDVVQQKADLEALNSMVGGATAELRDAVARSATETAAVTRKLEDQHANRFGVLEQRMRDDLLKL
jgi:hypothetical protein